MGRDFFQYPYDKQEDEGGIRVILTFFLEIPRQKEREKSSRTIERITVAIKGTKEKGKIMRDPITNFLFVLLFICLSLFLFHYIRAEDFLNSGKTIMFTFSLNVGDIL